MEEKNMYNQGCLVAFKDAIEFANKRKYEFVSVDSYMLFLSKTPKGKEILEAMGVNLKHYEESVVKYLDEVIPKNIDGNIRPMLTVQLNLLKEIVLNISKAANKEKVEEGHFFVSLFELEDDDCFTLNYFSNYDITRFDLMSFIAHGKNKNAELSVKTATPTKNLLHKFAVCLNKKAQDKKIDGIIGRDKEINEMIEILCQKKKNNPMLVGDAGVGKTAIIEGLAKKIEDGDVPEIIKDFQIYMLDLPAILAGTKYRGDFEERFKAILKEASADPQVVLAIDEIHTLIGSGASSSSNMDTANMLKPMLSSGEIKLIGATTYAEYTKFFEKEAAFNRRFKKIDVIEPTRNETIKIILGLKPQYESFHNVDYNEDSISLAVDLSIKYINDKFLPDKAFDVIDLAGSKAKINGVKTITQEYIKQVFAEMTRLPIEVFDESQKNNIKNLDIELKKEIFGQDEAINQIVDIVILSRSNLINTEKPIGSFMLAGPTGVGKTELSKQLARKMNVPFIRIDMSEYMEKYSVSKLIGSPPGYIGSEVDGYLIEQIRKTPNCVLLLDEIEKADPQILNALLQVMDYGKLTGNNGKKADFKNVLLMMTTNIGANQISKARMGFSKNANESVDRTNEIKKAISPEFFNRLDAVIQFNSLTEIEITKVVKKHLNELQESLLGKKIIAFFDDSLVEFISKEGFDEKLGARPIQRYIQKNISIPLSKEIVFGNLENGGEVKIYADGGIKFDFIHKYKDTKDKSIVEDIKPKKSKKTTKKV